MLFKCSLARFQKLSNRNQKLTRDDWTLDQVIHLSCPDPVLMHVLRRTSSNIQSYTVSKAVDSEVNKPPSLPFMV